MLVEVLRVLKSFLWAFAPGWVALQNAVPVQQGRSHRRSIKGCLRSLCSNDVWEIGAWDISGYKRIGGRKLMETPSQKFSITWVVFRTVTLKSSLIPCRRITCRSVNFCSIYLSFTKGIQRLV